MAIKVVFPTGAASITVAGLYQWDYGQTLEIECPEIGSEIVEVHFACTGMSEAIVRPCTFVSGIGTVIIPDRCLEQTSPITAWIYKVDSKQGHTIKTITLPLTARTRPGKVHDIPPSYIDKYADLIQEVNETVNAMERGDITVMFATGAESARNADYAKTSGNASSATYATSAGSATQAGSATRADTAGKASLLMVAPDYPYCKITLASGSGSTSKTLDEGLYIVNYDDGNRKILSGILCIGTLDERSRSYSLTLGTVALWCEERSAGGMNVSLISLNSTHTISMNGTLSFIRIGNISHG